MQLRAVGPARGCLAASAPPALLLARAFWQALRGPAGVAAVADLVRSGALAVEARGAIGVAHDWTA
eukprot:2430427-Lingulodinium_polyedra.AAC.1